jgi:hypothetical protein
MSFLPRIKYGVNSSRNPVFPRGPGLPLSRERQEMEFFRGLIGLPAFTPIYVRPSEAEMKWEEKHPNFL